MAHEDPLLVWANTCFLGVGLSGWVSGWAGVGGVAYLEPSWLLPVCLYKSHEPELPGRNWRGIEGGTCLPPPTKIVTFDLGTVAPPLG